MNQKLKNILNKTKQNKNLTRKEIELILKELKKADKELESSAFKLVKKEKEKKSTATLLKKTIKELEQKQKAVETHKRKLAIEAALEKVRKIAMGMRKPVDMLNVCKTISLQLQSLGVKEIRNVQTAIFYEQRGTYMNYEYYAKHNKTFITETVYTNHKIHNKFATKMLKGKGEIFITHIKNKEVKEWIAYQKTTNVFIDKYLETASSLNYYWFSLGPVALGISTYHPLTEEETNLFKRFLKVFELAYRRYLDIEQAEAQAREAQIEASLERVRAVAMSMHTSDDLLSICEISFKEFQKLGFENLRNAIIHVLYDQEKFFMDYDFSEQLGGNITKLEYDSHPIVMDYFKQIRSAEDAFAEVVIKDEQLKSWKKFRRNTGQHDDPRLEKISALYYYGYSIGIGAIGISTFKPIDKSQIKILKRFRNVFDLTYRRYNDIALAEKQARESQIQLALERVRARTMAMQKSDELAETAYVLFQQFSELGEDPNQLSIGIFNEAEQVVELWLSVMGNKMDRMFKAPFDEPIVVNKIYRAWKAKKKSLVIDISGEELKVYNKFRNSLVEFKEYNEIKNSGEQEHRRVMHCALFQKGLLSLATPGPRPDETIRLLERFAQVFDGTYTRFLDLQRAEAQAREAQIENALEKVRSRSLAMHKSDELKEVVTVLFERLRELNLTMDTANIEIYRNDFRNYEMWVANSDYTYPEPFYYVYFDDLVNNEVVHHKELAQISGEEVFTRVYRAEIKNKYWIYLFDHTMFGNLPDDRKNLILNSSAWSVSCVYSKHSGIVLMNYNDKLHSKEELNILKRFSRVFEQAYIRFMDLEKAEAQAREAKIEASLERVRAVAMSMHKSDDLLSICEISFKEFQKLGFENLRNALIHILNDEKRFFIDYDYSELMGGSIVNIKYGSHPIIDDYMKKIRSAKDALAEVIITKDQLQGWKDFRKESGQYDDPRLDKAKGLYYYLHSIGIGDIGISTLKPIDEDQIKILKRFRNVFDLAYRRYNDIALAEKQARETQIQLALERVRARTMAMHKSEELSETSFVLFEQLKELGEVAEQMSITIYDEKQGIVQLYSTIYGNKWEETGKLPFQKHIVLRNIHQAWKERKKSIVIDLSGKKLNDFNNFKVKYSTQYKSEEELPKTRWVMHYVFFSKGALTFSTYEPRPTETINLLERFAAVFDLTYTRFLDLQKAEAQAREAQIEAAIERVRARTMAMQKSEELAETAGVLFKQMESLGIVPKRSVIGIINQRTNKARLWSTSSDGKVIPGFDLVPLTEEKHLIKVYRAWKNKEVHLAFKISGKDRLVWTNYVMNKVKMHLPEYQPDKINPEQLLKEPAFFNCFFFTQGFLMVHTAKDLSDEYIPILKRFAGVFEQTYTRFLDLKNAEKQAKEAKIEAALERVRSRSMAMHHTSELQDVINTVHQQFKSLDMDITGGAFIAINKENENEIACWGAGGTADYVERVKIPYFNRPIYTGLIENIQKGPGFYAEDFSYKEKIEFFNHLFRNPPYSDASQEHKKEILSRDGGYIRSCAVSKHTNIFIINHHGRKFSEEENNILIRFGKVFEQSYTRFLDLQKAEAQAREAQIEAALERVRAVALSLKKSDEMLDIAEVLYEQLLELGFTNIRNAMIDIHNDKKETILDYDYSPDMGRSINLMSYYAHPIIEKKVRQIASSSDAFFEIILEGQDLQDNIELRLKNGEEEDPRLRQIEQLTYNLYSFGNGAIGISNFGVLSDEQKIVLKRFRNVFAFAYKRYSDLVQAENQARESLIQLALERVRARTMAMQVSDELAETAAIVFKQLIALGIAPNRLYIGIIKDDSGTVEFWITDEDGTKVSQQFMGNVSRNLSMQKMYDGWKKQKKSIVIDMQGDELKEYFQYLSNELHVPFKQGLSQKRRIQNIAYFSKGFIGLASPEPQPEETVDLLERFAAVFNLTYTRFNDLQQAEAQNKIIKAENERKTQELEEARQLQLAMLPKELPQLPNLDVAVYMKTATEVGGDYYDFQVGMDGMLTTVIGDATGHGMKAGTVVTITKSLFNSMAANENILSTFDKISQVIKGMKFRQLAMCLLMMKIRGNRLSMSAAAMPPALIYRTKNKTVEEIFLKGMPLGTLKNFPYRKIESRLYSGDTILLYSDGLPELANDEGQMYGYDKIKKEYHSIGEKEPEQIVEHLKNSASQWVNGKEPDDDVTFVVIKIK